MSRTCRRYTFAAEVSWEDVLASLLLASWAAASLHGETTVLLEGWYRHDDAGRAVAIDIATAVGRDLDRVFCGFLRREFSAQLFRVETAVIDVHHEGAEAGTGSTAP